MVTFIFEFKKCQSLVSFRSIPVSKTLKNIFSPNVWILAFFLILHIIPQRLILKADLVYLFPGSTKI